MLLYRMKCTKIIITSGVEAMIRTLTVQLSSSTFIVPLYILQWLGTVLIILSAMKNHLYKNLHSDLLTECKAMRLKSIGLYKEIVQCFQIQLTNNLDLEIFLISQSHSISLWYIKLYKSQNSDLKGG